MYDGEIMDKKTYFFVILGCCHCFLWVFLKFHKDLTEVGVLEHFGEIRVVLNLRK